MQGATNGLIVKVAIARSDMQVGMTVFVVAVMMPQFTWVVIKTSSYMMEKSEESDDNVITGLKFSLITPFICISFKFASTGSLSHFDAPSLWRKWQFYIFSLSLSIRFWSNWLLATFEYPLSKFQICHYN